MPPAVILIFLKSNGKCPVEEWIDGLQAPEAHKCIARILQLKAWGHELRRPTADLLRDGIYELRAGPQLRILYFFDPPGRAVLTDVIRKKTNKVPPNEIDQAIEQRSEYLRDRKGRSKPYMEG